MGTKQAVKPERVFRKYKRAGGITESEKALVAQFVADQPTELVPAQVNALAKTLNRSKEATLHLIEQARELFLTNADRYVNIHMAAVEGGLADGSAKGLEQARLGAEWAIEHMSGGGARIVEAAEKGNGNAGVQIMVGVKIGGQRE